jgi:hypothetical protein
VGTLRCDSATEYSSAAFRALFKEYGTDFKRSAPYYHGQNGVAERGIGVVVSRARTMLHARGVPAEWWGEAAKHAMLVTNMLPTRALPHDMTPHKMWYGDYGPLDRLRIFWCTAWVRVENGSKLEARAREGRYIGPSVEHKAFRVYIPSTNRIVDTVHVSFNEDPVNLCTLPATDSTITLGPEQLLEPTQRRTRAQTAAHEQAVVADEDDTCDGLLADLAEESAPPSIARPPAVSVPPPAGEGAPSEPGLAKMASIHGVVPIPALPANLKGKQLIGHHIGFKFNPPYGWETGGLVTKYTPNHRQQLYYDVQWPGEPRPRGHGLPEQAYNFAEDAPYGSWFIIDGGAATALTVIAPGQAPATVHTLVQGYNNGDESIKLEHIYARMASYDAVERECDTWPNHLTVEDMNDYAYSIAAFYEGMHVTQARAFVAGAGQTAYPRDPLSFGEAMKGPYREDWIAAMEAEMKQLEEGGTFTVVPRPSGTGKRLIGSKWIYKTKRNPDGSIDKRKARLVAQGFSQVAGVDFDENMIHAPVVRHTTLRLVACFCAKHGLRCDQMDVTGAYIQSFLDEKDILMELPKGYKTKGPNGEEMCLELHRSLYGLRQSGNNWNRRIDGWFREHGFKPSDGDPCLYIKRDSLQRVVMLVCLYVDDLMIAGPNQERINSFKAEIAQSFTIKDLGPARYLLGMEIKRDFAKGTLEISQQKYIKEMLEIYGMADCTPTPTPAADKQRLTKNMSPQTDEERAEMHGIRYRHAVGHLLYLAMVSRFDIMNSVRELTRFMQEPGMEHWAAVKRVMRYIKGTIDVPLIFGPFPPGEVVLVGYSDSDWAGELDTRRSTTGYVFLMAGGDGKPCSGAVSVNSRLQPTVALSSTEAEYMAVCSAAQEAIYLRVVLFDMGMPQRYPTRIYEDNTAAIRLANAAVGQWHPRTRHVDVRYKFVKERVRSNEIELVYVKTTEQLADLLTKNLAAPQFSVLAQRILGHWRRSN